MKKIRYYSSFLPNQKVLKKYFTNKDYEKKLYTLISNHSNIINPKKKYKLTNGSGFLVEEMASNPISLNFLNFLTSMIKPKYILEIGAFIGLSTMELTQNLKKGGKVVSLEKYEKFYKICKKNFNKNRLDKKIKIVLGDALETLKFKKFRYKFDFIFIDGNKEKYKEIFVECEKLVSKNGIIVVDNIFNQGDVLNKNPKTSKGAGVKRFLKYVRHKKYSSSILPFYDGIMLIKKLSS